MKISIVLLFILLLTISASGCIDDYSFWAQKNAKFYGLRDFCTELGGKFKINTDWKAICKYDGKDYFIFIHDSGKMELTEEELKPGSEIG